MSKRLRVTTVTLITSAITSGVLGLAVLSTGALLGNTARDVALMPYDLPAQTSSSSVAKTPKVAVDFDTRVAKRLQDRIAKRENLTIDVQTLSRNIRDQRDLLSHSVVVSFRSSIDKSVVSVWTGSLLGSAQWFTVNVSPAGVETGVNAQAIENDLRVSSPFTIPAPQRAIISDVAADKDGVLRAATSGLAKTGFDYDPAVTASVLTDAFVSGKVAAEVMLTAVDSPFQNASATDLGQLRLLATGHSDFAGSGGGRKANVRKGTNKYLQNTVVAPGEKFSLNKVFSGAPLSEWEMALIIVNGHDLQQAPGGGLCQVATTLYRAVLNAGLPVVVRANHSLYVTYYEKHGVGIDATILPPKQDFVFRNDTPSYLVIQAYTEGDEAFVSIYGTPDGRTASMEGPFFAATAPEGFLVNGRTMQRNEIAWQRFVTRADGSEIKETILSRYNAIPRSLPEKYGHAAAPEVQVATIGR
jgi:hypothetical protein